MKDLTKDYPAKVIILFAIPLMIGNIAQHIYNITDSKIVSLYVGPNALAAVGATAVISNLLIGFMNGLTQGFAHKDKPVDKIVATKGNMPDWFSEGLEAAMLAPTAMNQQKFTIGMIDGEPAIKVSKKGSYTDIDLGIVKCHFEIGSGRKVR